MNYKINIHKRIIAFLLSFVIVFSTFICIPLKVQAVVGVDDIVLAALTTLIGVCTEAEQSGTYATWYENSYRPRYQQFVVDLFTAAGVRSSAANIFAKIGGDPIQNARIWLSQHSGTPQNQITDDQCKEALYNMCHNSTVNAGDDAFIFSGDLLNYTQYWINEYMNSTGYVYAYSYDVLNSIPIFTNGDQFAALRRFLSSSTYDYNILFNSNFILGVNYEDLAFLRQNSTSTGYQCKYYDFSNWNNITWKYTNMTLYKYDTNTGEYEQNTSQDLSYIYACNYCYLGKYDSVSFTFNSNGYLVDLNKTSVYKVYLTLNDLKADQTGIAPYYITDSFNEFKNSSTTYTTNNNNYNPITYGDINTWVVNNTPADGVPPTPKVIQRYIDTYTPTQDNPNDPTNPNNPNGGNGTTSGNSVGGNASATANATANATNGNVDVTINNNPSITIGWPTLSGNGVSDNTVSGNTITGGVDNIFGFISYLGLVLGNLIKNVGNALVDLVEGIADIIASIFEAIPNVFNDFMTGVFGWLPPELRSLIVLAISAMLIVGIIKLIRG